MILPLRIRRATTEDLHHLRALWSSMHLREDELQNRLTEFQVVVDADNTFLGAMGFQVSGTQALLHNEGYTDFSAADNARDLFWERIRILAANHMVFRLWTQERSPAWKTFGFRPTDAETLARLPAEWRNEFDDAWLTLQLKDEEAITTALKTEFAGFMETEKKQTERVMEQAQTMRTIITVIGFLIAFLSFGLVAYLLVHRSIPR